MEALLLQDGVYVNNRYEQLQEKRRQLDHNETNKLSDECIPVTASSELCDDERYQLEQWRIVERVKALHAKGPTPQLNKKFFVLQEILEKLYTTNEADRCVTSPSNGPLKRLETDANAPVSFKELPIPTQVVLKMFFRTCQSLRNPAKLAVNSRLSVQIANKLPTILTTMPSCVLSPGLIDDVQVELEDGGNVWSVFYQLFQLFEELLGLNSESSSSAVRVCLSTNDRATIIVAYVALSLKWGRLGYLMKGVRLLLENANELDGTRFEPLQPLFHELAATLVEKSQVAFDEEEQPYGFLMSFGKGDHGKLGHGQCVHVSCQEGNCTENKMSPTVIAATRDVLFRKIDSLSTHSIAITAKGEAMSWGNGDKYRLGHGSSTKEYTPRTIEFLSLKGRVRDLACGLGHTMALMESGELFAWGNGSNGRLGLGDVNDRSSPTKVVVPFTSQRKEAAGGNESNATSTQVRFRHIFCGASHSLGISWDGRAYAWGKNNQGQCGHGHTNDQWTIQEIENFRDSEYGEEEECITYAAGGWEHTLFCTASGRVYSCGCGYKDSRRAGIPPVLGHGDCDRRLKPTLVQALDDGREEIIKVACGWDHSLAVSASGKVYTWGSGTNGKLGHGDEESVDIPTLVCSIEGKQVKDAKAGCEHTVFLTHDHELWTCGQGDSGRLGHGDNQTRKRPKKIELFAELGLKPVALAVGDKYNLVMVKDCDGQHELEGEPTSIQKRVEKTVSAHVSSPNILHGRHRKEQHKTPHDSQEKGFGANWVLNVAAGIEPQGSSAAKSAASRDPDSASSVALFIAGHVDRLASDYISDESELGERYEESKVTETQSKAQKTVVLPFTTDTSYESMHSLLQLLQLATTPTCTSLKENAMRSGSDSSSGLFLGTQGRIGLALSCLRILQLNLKKSQTIFHLPVQKIIGDTTSGLVDLFGHIHKLLDSLAGLTVEDTVNRFDNDNCRSGSTLLLSALGGAITHEAACALKMGFGIFYPTGSSRCRLLWDILDDCKVDTPSMRTAILSDQLCKDSIMTEIFRSLTTNSLVSLQKELSGAVQSESIARKGMADIKTPMIVLLTRSSAEAIKHLDNEAFSDFTSKPDCFLRLLHVLQMHYFSIAHRSAIQEDLLNEKCYSKDQIQWRNEIVDSLLEYVDALMTESLRVLKTLHKGSRQHEEIITWRLNGSFFHTLLPSAIECLSVMLLPVQNHEKVSGSSVTRTIDNLLLVHRVLPNLHVMLKMLDEVSWKMHSANDPGNQAHDDSPFSHQTGFTAQERNWFVDLGNVCAVLCGKLSCELFYSSTFITADDTTQHGMYYSLILTEGWLLKEEHAIVSAAEAQMSNPISSILNWERLGVFEVEDEFVGCKDDANTSGSVVSSENQHFILQFSETDYSIKPLSFWRWVAVKLSDVVEFTVETERLLTLVVSVSSWHLGFVEELRQVHELYDAECLRTTTTESAAPLGGIWRMLSSLLDAAKQRSWIYSSIDLEIVTNAIKLSRLLLNLRPNPAFVPPVFRHEKQHADPFWGCTDDSLLEMLGFLTRSVDVDTIQRYLAKKEVHGALLRTGICILHDLLRKLTTSSTKSCLLDEFVAVICGTHRVSSTPMMSTLPIILSRDNDNDINKAIENLFVRLARIVSSEDASFDLKKKALMAWAVPLSVSTRDVPCVVALVAKSGIMSTLVELLLDEANVLDANSDINASAQAMIYGNQDGGISQVELRQPAKVFPMKTLLFDQTPAQIISGLAWEVFCAIAMQLSKSERFAEHRPNMLLRAAGSSLHDRDPLTPRSISMSPRRRLTLPKKMVISSIDEIIEQMIDGLFLMLKGVNTRLDILDTSSKEFKTLFKPTKEIGKTTERSIQQKSKYARVFLLGHPVQISHSSSHDIGISMLKDTGNTTEHATSLSLSFWIYIERTGAMVNKTTLDADGASSRPKESSVRLLGFSSDPTPESADAPRDGSVIVFTRDAYPDHVSLGLSMRCGGSTDGSWCSILVDELLPCGKWVQVMLSFDEERPEHLQAFVGARRSTLNNGQQSVDHCKIFCLKFLQHANSWTQLATGGNVDVDALTNIVRETNTESLRLSILQKKPIHGVTAVLDDVVITRGVLTEEMVVRMQINGPVLFRLKQQYIAESHRVKVLRLLWQLVGTREQLSREVPLARLSPSDRWIELFSQMLLSTTCTHDQALAQVYLCNLLADVLPRATPLPEFDVQSLGQELFSTRQMKSASVEELFTTFNGQSNLSSASTIRRQNEALYRTMQQHGMLHVNYRGGGSSDNDEMLALRQKTSIRFAAAVHLFQPLLSSPSWRSRMDQLVGSSNAMFHCPGGWKDIIHSEETNAIRLADMTAVVTALAGYSEEVVNAHCAAVQDATILPSPTQAWCSPFDSVIQFDDSNASQTANVQDLVRTMLREETRQALCLPPRKDILATYHNDVVAANAVDVRISTVIHQRARVLRVLMTTLLREKNEVTSNSWHDFLLENTNVCDDLLQVASSNMKEYVTMMLGVDAKIAMKLRRVRNFFKEVLRGGKHRRGVPSVVSVADLENLQWRLWEETTARLPSAANSIALIPWWQQSSESYGKVSLDIVGGDVEVCDLKVKALEHFPTVRLAQANICANSGLWFFEVVVLTDGLMQIGYVDGDFTADPLQGQGVGDHTNSWAFDGFRCKKWNGNSYDYGEQWKADDVVGVLLDTERMEISYFLNGKFLGVAFSGISITASSRICPAASLNVNQSAEFNFGTSSAGSLNENGIQTSGVGGFKHMPVLDNEDQTRLRPVIAALQTRRTSKANGTSNVGNAEKEEAKENDTSEEWSSTSSTSDMDDGEIVLEVSGSLSGFRRNLELGSRDGRETSTMDQNDEEVGQRRRDLIEGLTGLGFPLEWATRCTTEAHLPMDETSAVTWISEQMEKIGLDGIFRLPTTSTISDDGGDRGELPGQPAALWSTHLQLPNLVASHLAGNLAAEAVVALPGTGITNTLERLNDIDIPPPSEPRSIPVFFPPISSLSDKLTTTSVAINDFIDADIDDQHSDDAASETFQSGVYRQQHSGLQLSNVFSRDSKHSVDDLVPLAIVVDTTVFIAYARQSFTSLLLLGLREEKREGVHRMLRRLVSSEDSSARLHRCLRITVGLDTMDAAFEMGYISESIHSSRSLQLQKVLSVLLKHETKNISGEAENLGERTPLLNFFCQEMMNQCDRGLAFVRAKQSSKTMSDPLAIQLAAAWFGWVAGMVIGFVEDQLSEASSSSVLKAENRFSAYDVPPFSSTVFLEKLVTIASSTTSTSKAWKYVAFRLIARILFVIRADTSSEFFATAQLANLTDLFALRYRREMYNRVFFSDVTSTLFILLVRSSASLSCDSQLDKRQHSEHQGVSLRVNNYSSTHVAISWDQTSCTALSTIPTKQSDSEHGVDAATSETRTEVVSTIMFLDVTRCDTQHFGRVVQDDSSTIASKVLPSKGTFTIRNLLPDTQYRIRLGPAQVQNDNSTGASDVPSNDVNSLQRVEVIVQTPPDPVFELDRETMGKNLMVFNRNLTAKNTANKKWNSVRASVAFDEGVHKWQVRLDTCISKNIFIGVCTADASMENYVGSDANGYGFLANKAVWHNKAKLHSYGEIFKQGDIIEVTLDCNAKTLAFSRNGEYLGIAASDMRAGPSRSGVGGSTGSDGNCKWYPAFSMYNKDDKVTLIPPSISSVFSTKESRPQNASTFDLIDAMQHVLVYQNHLAGIDSNRYLSSKFFEKAFEEFEGWRRGEKLFREISHGHVIAIDKSKSATDKYGLATGDSVFTSKGQCTVLGEYRHELWYEVDEGGSSSLFETTATQLASWSLSSCREMLESPDEYPVHRHHKYKFDMESNTITGADSTVEQLDTPTDTADEEMFSLKTFVDAQVQWRESGISAAEADTKLIAELDGIASSQASSSATLLSFADVSTALLLEKIYEVHGISAGHGSNQTMARIGLLLYVNRCLYNIVRVAMTRNIFATSLGTSESPELVANQSNSSKQVLTGRNTESHQVSPVAALLNSSHWALDDPSAFTWMPSLAARLLFSSQKEKLIDEDLRTTKTTSQTLDSLKDPNDNDDGSVDSDLPVIKISYPLSRATPFWETKSTLLKKKSRFCISLSAKSSVFVQLANQLAAHDARQWRREFSQPFEAIPISQAFQVQIEKPSSESSGEVGKDDKNGQQQYEDDEENLQQPSSKQTARYLNIFENAVLEIQSPCFPLFAPAHGTRIWECEPRHPLQLDINVELFSPPALAHSRVQSSRLLLWYFCFGQILGIAWRSKLLLPLQFLTGSFWQELVTPVDPRVNEFEAGSGRVRDVAIRAIRDGLFSIIPSRCVALLSGNNPILRDRLSDLDVSYVTRLERHAIYSVPRQSHHELFWMTVNAFTSVERRMLEQFINPEGRNGTKQVEAMYGTTKSSIFVLEIADALADGRDNPDSCYPVIVSIAPHSGRLHLPAYSSAQTLRNKLLLAMTNIPFM